MTVFTKRTSLALTASLVAAGGLIIAWGSAEARVRHRVHRAAPVEAAPSGPGPGQQAARQQGVVGYFGPGAYGPYGYGPLGPFTPGYAYGYAPHGDLGFALLGAANGGGLRGFVECGNYYARYPGACGF